MGTQEAFLYIYVWGGVLVVYVDEACGIRGGMTGFLLFFGVFGVLTIRAFCIHNHLLQSRFFSLSAFLRTTARFTYTTAPRFSVPCFPRSVFSLLRVSLAP